MIRVRFDGGQCRPCTGRPVADASAGRVTVALTGATPVLTERFQTDLRDPQNVEAVTVSAALPLLVLGLGSVGSALVVLVAAVVAVLVSTGALDALALVPDPRPAHRPARHHRRDPRQRAAV